MHARSPMVSCRRPLLTSWVLSLRRQERRHDVPRHVREEREVPCDDIDHP
ncbi:hypothetical protein [Brachybacterium tyrofermentans]